MTDLSSVHDTGGAYALTTSRVERRRLVTARTVLLTLHTINTVAGRMLAHGALLAVAALVLLAAGAATLALDRPLSLDLGLDPRPVLAWAVVLGGGAALTYLAFLAAVRRAPRPLASFLVGLRENVLLNPRWSNALPVLVSAGLLLAATSMIAALLPALDAAAFGRALTALDQGLHLGWHPYELTYWIAGSPALTGLLDETYRAGQIWLALFALALAFAYDDTPLRQRFFAAAALTWALGASLMLLAAAAGPAHEAHLAAGGGPYAPLSESLGEIDRSLGLWSLPAQAAAQQALEQGGTGIAVAGLPPSLAVALLTLVALASFRTRRWLGWSAALITALTGLAAVHLGWSHAVPCYAGALLAAGLWSVLGRFAPWRS